MQSLDIRDAYGASIPTLQHDDRLVGDRLVATAEAAKILGARKGTLVVWRSQQRYALPYVKIGRKVMYRISDLLAFIETRIVRQVKPESERLGRSPTARRQVVRRRAQITKGREML